MAIRVALAWLGVLCTLSTSAAAAIRQPHVTPFGAPAAPPTSPHLTYFGGRVISNAQVVQVLYGGTQSEYVSGVWNTSTPSLATFYSGVPNSAYFDWLTEYDTPPPGAGTNQVIGRGVFFGQRHITPSAPNDGSTITDAQIQAEIGAQITAAALPPPSTDAAGNPKTVYMIDFPAGKTIALGSLTSCVSGGFCAYHSAFAVGQQIVYYGVLPDMGPLSGCNGGCGGDPSPFNNQTATASHELVESVTDPIAGNGWTDPNNGEIGDICNQQQARVIGGDGVSYVVQRQWSNAAGACIVTRAATVAVAAPATGRLAPWLAVAMLAAGLITTPRRRSAR